MKASMSGNRKERIFTCNSYWRAHSAFVLFIGGEVKMQDCEYSACVRGCAVEISIERPCLALLSRFKRRKDGLIQAGIYSALYCGYVQKTMEISLYWVWPLLFHFLYAFA